MTFNIPKDFLNTPIVILNKTGISFEGEIEYNETFRGLGRVEKYNKQKWNINGDVADYDWVVYLDGDVTVSNDSKCTIDNGKEYIVKDIDKHIKPYSNVISHTKLYLK